MPGWCRAQRGATGHHDHFVPFLPFVPFLSFVPFVSTVGTFTEHSTAKNHQLYLAIVSSDGGLVISDTTTINAHEISVIGTTGVKPFQTSAPGTRAV